MTENAVLADELSRIVQDGRYSAEALGHWLNRHHVVVATALRAPRPEPAAGTWKRWRATSVVKARMHERPLSGLTKTRRKPCIAGQPSARRSPSTLTLCAPPSPPCRGQRLCLTMTTMSRSTRATRS